MEKVQADPKGLMTIGEVAARNIALSLKLDEKKVPTIEKAIRDEIQAMSSHFTLALADVQTSYEIDVKQIKSAYTYVKSNLVIVLAAILGSFVVGALVGHFA